MKNVAVAFFLLSLAVGCGSSSAKHEPDGSRPTWGWDVSSANSPDEGPVPPSPDANLEPDVPTVEQPVDAADPVEEDAGIPVDEGDAAPVQSYQCGDGYVCLTSCENRCGLHELGRSTCLCKDGVLQCNDCPITTLARPQVPETVSATCADGIVSGAACSQVGDACFVNPDSPYPIGCLCWPTATGMIWSCAPVFGWFTLPPDAGQ
jgi:hypothetical protein